MMENSFIVEKEFKAPLNLHFTHNQCLHKTRETYGD